MRGCVVGAGRSRGWSQRSRKRATPYGVTGPTQDSNRTQPPLDVDVSLISATLSNATGTLVSA